MKIGIVVGSIREGRKGELVKKWVEGVAGARSDAEFETVDLKDFDVPLLASETIPGAAKRQYDSAEVRRWGRAIDDCDGFLFITPEYNHGVPGPFKNAFDSIGPEWQGKPVGFVSYGADGGIRAVEQWRQITANFSMVDVRAQVPLSLFGEFDENGLNPQDRREGELSNLLDQLVAMAARLAG